MVTHRLPRHYQPSFNILDIFRSQAELKIRDVEGIQATLQSLSAARDPRLTSMAAAGRILQSSWTGPARGPMLAAALQSALLARETSRVSGYVSKQEAAALFVTVAASPPPDRAGPHHGITAVCDLSPASSVKCDLSPGPHLSRQPAPLPLSAPASLSYCLLTPTGRSLHSRRQYYRPTACCVTLHYCSVHSLQSTGGQHSAVEKKLNFLQHSLLHPTLYIVLECPISYTHKETTNFFLLQSVTIYKDLFVCCGAAGGQYLD